MIVLIEENNAKWYDFNLYCISDTSLFFLSFYLTMILFIQTLHSSNARNSMVISGYLTKQCSIWCCEYLFSSLCLIWTRCMFTYAFYFYKVYMSYTWSEYIIYEFLIIILLLCFINVTFVCHKFRFSLMMGDRICFEAKLLVYFLFYNVIDAFHCHLQVVL